MSVPFSVVVPTYGRPERLARCLAALAHVETDAPFEVVVVDDGSPVPASVAAVEQRLDVRLVRQANAGPAAARNAGAQAARYPFLAFTDDDCEPTPAWLARLGAALAARPDALVGGRTVNALARNPFAEASQLLVSFLTDYYGRPGRVPFFASNNVALSAEGFAALGGFDRAFPLAAGEDRDLCARWHAQGRPSVYVPDAVVRHAHALTPAGFVRQHLHYGRGAYHYHRLRASAPVPEPLAFYGRLVAYPLSAPRRSVRSALHVALLGVAQVANVAGYAAEARAARRAARRSSTPTHSD